MTNLTTKQKKAKERIEIHLHTKFEFTRIENVERVALALGMAGYYVKIRGEQAYYLLEVYTDREEL